MTHETRARAAAGRLPEWIRPCNHPESARRRAEDVSAQLAAALGLAGPMVAEGFELNASIALTAAEGGGALHFRCSAEEVLCVCGDGDGAAGGEGGVLRIPVAGRLLN